MPTAASRTVAPPEEVAAMWGSVARVLVSVAFLVEVPTAETDGGAGAQQSPSTVTSATSTAAQAALVAAVELLPGPFRPRVPVIAVDPTTASPKLLRMSRGACAFVLEPARSVVFVRADCPALLDYLSTGDNVALSVVAALLAHENAHVQGAGETEARRVEMAVFTELTATSHPNDRKRALLWIAAAGARRPPRS